MIVPCFPSGVISEYVSPYIPTHTPEEYWSDHMQTPGWQPILCGLTPNVLTETRCHQTTQTKPNQTNVFQDSEFNVRVWSEAQDDAECESWRVVVRGRDELAALIGRLTVTANSQEETPSLTPNSTAAPSLASSRCVTPSGGAQQPQVDPGMSRLVLNGHYK